MNNYDPDRVLFWKSLKKCINSYTLDLGWDDIKKHLLEQKQSTLELWQVLTSAVLSKLPHPNMSCYHHELPKDLIAEAIVT